MHPRPLRVWLQIGEDDGAGLLCHTLEDWRFLEQRKGIEAIPVLCALRMNAELPSTVEPFFMASSRA